MKQIFKIVISIIVFSSLSFAFMGTNFGMGYTFGDVKPKKGFWAKYIIVSKNGDKTTIKTIYAGSVKYKNDKVDVVETDIKVDDQEMATMAFFKNFQMVKSITQTPMGLVCMEMGQMNNQAPMMGSTPSSKSNNIENPKEIKRKYPKIKKATYTTPTGKKVKCIVYDTGRGQVWLNNKIGVVKVVDNGKVTMYLYNFGYGASPKIDINQALSCQPQPMMMPMMPMQGVPMQGLPQ